MHTLALQLRTKVSVWRLGSTEHQVIALKNTSYPTLPIFFSLHFIFLKVTTFKSELFKSKLGLFLAQELNLKLYLTGSLAIPTTNDYKQIHSGLKEKSTASCPKTTPQCN